MKQYDKIGLYARKFMLQLDKLMITETVLESFQHLKHQNYFVYWKEN